MNILALHSCNLCGGRHFTKIAQGPDFEYRCADGFFSMVKCDSCGLVFLNPRPATSELETIYPPHYIPYRFDDHLNLFMRSIRMMVQKSKVVALRRLAHKDAVIWDVGCGGGWFLECLREYGYITWHLVGVDISECALNRVKTLGFPTLSGRFETLDVPPESVDVIILNQVIEHLDDPSAVITKAYQTLKPGGLLFIETPSFDGWDAKIFRARYWGGWHFPRHWTIFNGTTLRYMIEKNGFSVIEERMLLSPNFWVQSLHHWFIDHGVPEGLACVMDCKNPFAMAFFSCVDLVQKVFGHTSNMRMIGKKR